MVTVEQDSIQSQVGNSSPQTQNPQTLVPTNLQPNSNSSKNLQNVNPSNLFANPNADAVITISGGSTGSVESFLASETTAKTSSNGVSSNSLFIITVAAVIVVGSFLIVRKLLPTK